MNEKSMYEKFYELIDNAELRSLLIYLIIRDFTEDSKLQKTKLNLLKSIVNDLEIQ